MYVILLLPVLQRLNQPRPENSNPDLIYTIACILPNQAKLLFTFILKGSYSGNCNDY